ADNPDLATGQGRNKGAKILFDGDLVSGSQFTKKPGAELVDGNEYETDFIGRDSIQAFTLPEGQRLIGSARTLANRHFDKTTINGRTVYVRKGLSDDIDLSWLTDSTTKKGESRAQEKQTATEAE